MKNYTFSNVDVIVFAKKITGFSSGDDVVSITEKEQRYSSQIGADGSVVRTEAVGVLVEVKLKLQAMSPSNKDLTAIHQADRLTQGAGVGPLFITDKGDSVKYIVKTAWITGLPEIQKGEKPSDRTWTFEGTGLEAI